MMNFKTPNLHLRQWKIEDAPELYNLAKNPKIGPIAGWPPHEDIEYSKNVIENIFWPSDAYAILKDNVIIGSVAILIHPNGNYYWGDNCGELGYWIGEKYWGHGYAVEASKTLIKESKLDKIYATYNIDNYQSKRVLEKLNFKYYDSIYNQNGFLEVVMVYLNE